VHTGFWYGSLRGRHHFEDLGIDGRIILKSNDLQEMGWCGGALTGLIWLRIGTGDMVTRMR